MLKTQKKVAKAIKKKYEAKRKAGTTRPACSPEWSWTTTSTSGRCGGRTCCFTGPTTSLEPFEVRFSLDPETFEYSIKPVPLAWFYDERFVNFLEEFLWKVPRTSGLPPSIAHGGGQFSLSAKTFLTGSLLADDIAYKLNHPELATWIMDWPNPDDRAFRATRQRFQAFRTIAAPLLGRRLPLRARTGVLTAENAFLDRGFGPAASPPQGLMDDARAGRAMPVTCFKPTSPSAGPCGCRPRTSIPATGSRPIRTRTATGPTRSCATAKATSTACRSPASYTSRAARCSTRRKCRSWMRRWTSPC